jgi:ATP-binding cassette subfamily B protein
LAHLVKGRTTFAIAHRLLTLKNADKLLVIDDGKRAEFGTHDELLEKKGLYYKLVEMQTKLSTIKAVDG